MLEIFTFEVGNKYLHTYVGNVKSLTVIEGESIVTHTINKYLRN